MADYLDVSPQTVTRWTKAKTPVKRQTLMLWALATGVDREWLETGIVRQQGLEPRTR
ncbi:MAG TPA: helix-turn-helix domain-containing protein [Marmoricola sp.]|nr:helix-turn-helix domain-containing protein [Marmoricola sp.]